MEVELLYNVPGFVKEAGEHALDVTAPGAVVVGGFRLDSPASVWYASACLRKQAMENPLTQQSPYLIRMVKEACDLFGIGDDQFNFSESNYENVIVKEAGHTAEFIIGAQEDFEEAVDSLFQKRASAPYSFCKACACRLKELGDRNGYALESEKLDHLKKMAGEGAVDFAKGTKACRERAEYAKRRGMTTEAEILNKFASVCEGATDEAIVPLVIEGLDEFDRGVGCINKYASENIKHPEDYFYMSANECIQALANTSLAIDAKHAIKRGTLMKEANIAKIASWTEDCGYNLPQFPTPEEVVAVVKTMPDSLREEFLENFA